MTKLGAIASLFLIIAVAASSAFTVSAPSVRSSTELKMTILTYGGKKMDFKAGSPLKAACAKLGVKPKYSCAK